jgi:tetratricopeptide (TPR) repeat protein
LILASSSKAQGAKIMAECGPTSDDEAGLPDTVAELYRSALIAHQAGHVAEASAGYRQILSLNSHHADATYLLAMIRWQQGDLLLAEFLLRKALDLREDANFLASLAQLLHETCRLSEAETAYRSALALDPNFVTALCNFGSLLKLTGNLAEAEQSYRNAIAIQPTLIEAHFNLSNLLQDTQRFQEAELSLRVVLELMPNHAGARCNLGNLLKRSKCYDAAEAEYRVAIELQPDFAEAYFNLGGLFQGMGRVAEAESAFRKSVELRPNYVDAHYNLGKLLNETRHLAEAEAEYRYVLAIEPQHADARWNLALLLLLLGRYEEGWSCYEARYDENRSDGVVNIPKLSCPQWRGESLVDKSLVIWPEQGFGDYIQFSRYAKLLKERGVSRLTMVCDPPLKPLLETLDAVDFVITESEPIPSHDFWSLPMSLPLHFGTCVTTIPDRVPYLYARAERVESWQQRIPVDGFRVGVVWRGHPGHANDAQRSLPNLEILAPLWRIAGTRFISLQTGLARGGDVVTAACLPIVPLGSEIRDFADTAAIIAQLDLVISVDTATAHLAGAMGKPCWLLLPMPNSDWRWLVDRQDSPWYPSAMRLFRQTDPQGWLGVVGEVERSLAKLVHASGFA